VSAPGIAGAQPSIPIPPGAGSCDQQGICFTADPSPPGQCTWYALGRRPDLGGIVQGNASRWLETAAGRAPEGTRPVVGAIAVWAPNTGPAGAVGHVAYVAAVHGSRLLVDDSNWEPTSASPPLQVHEHWVPAGPVEGYIYPPAAPAG
jgi:surface antigen